MLILNIFFFIYTNALSHNKESTIFYARLIILSLIVNSYINYYSLDLTSLSKGISLYGGLFNITSLNISFNILIILVSAIILTYNSFFFATSYNNKSFADIARSCVLKITSMIAIFSKDKSNHYNEEKSYISLTNKLNIYNMPEYPLIILFVITGAICLASSGDLISLFISIELQSYGLYILSTIHKDSEKSTWGGLTYFLLGGLSSCFILLGCALLYINSGTTSLQGIYVINSIGESTLNDLSSNLLWFNPYNTYYINISLVILMVGFLFKISAAPFHFWSPDVYDALPTTVTTFVAIIAKLSILVLALDLVYYLGEKTINTDLTIIYSMFSTNYNFSWKTCLIISSMFSLIIGSVLGITQKRIKRVYAYSTISHVGFILMALSVNSIESINAFIFYLISYTLSNLNAFIILVSIGYHLYITNSKNKNILNNVKSKSLNLTISDLNHTPIETVDNLKGYFYINPYLCISLTITLFSFIGIPPLVGFFAKQKILSAALDNGYIAMTLLAIITSVIGAVYYLGIIKIMFFYKNPNDLIIAKHKNTNILNDNNIKPNIKVFLSSQLSFIIANLTLAILVFIIIPNESFNIANILSFALYI